MYWAGSDRDGAVAGFYWAVVETLPIPPEGSSSVPPLPGPKPRDYHYTTATDSTFIFTASEEVSERQHAFFIYAVDNKGRPDPTPARFVFSSYDRFPPVAVIDELKAVGTEYELDRLSGVLTPVLKTYLVTDFYEISNEHFFPRDTVTSNARLHVRWHGVPTIPTTVVTGYRYKLDEPNFNTADSSVHEVDYNTGVGNDKVSSGQKIFTLRALGQSGWRGESTRWFQMNFAPDTWFAGPDPNDPRAGWETIPHPFGGRALKFDLTGWGAFQGIPDTPLSADSLTKIPPLRRERKTFLEIYNDRLWVRQEDDTVHLNSWVVFPAGGFDRDSPYNVKVNVPLLDSITRVEVLAGNLPVLKASGPNGSPVGFRIRVQIKDASGSANQPSETTSYPVFDPASVLDQRVINGYWGLTTAGRAYAVIRAEDGDGTVDRRVDQQLGDAVGVADRVDAGGGSLEDRQLRSKILTFYVNHPPQLLTASMSPRPGVTLGRRMNNFNLPASDDDHFDARQGNNKIGGTPTTYSPTLRRKIAILGKLTGTTRDTCYIEPHDFFLPNIGVITIPDWIATGNIIVRIRLCDCTDCDATPGTATCPFRGQEGTPNSGTCVDTDIPCRLSATEPASIIGGTGEPTQRPPEPGTDRGRRQP